MNNRLINSRDDASDLESPLPRTVTIGRHVNLMRRAGLSELRDKARPHINEILLCLFKI